MVEGVRTLYVLKLSSGPSVFCPMKDKPVGAQSCVRCEWNVEKKVVPLPRDEIRGVGYVLCTYQLTK